MTKLRKDTDRHLPTIMGTIVLTNNKEISCRPSRRTYRSDGK